MVKIRSILSQNKATYKFEDTSKERFVTVLLYGKGVIERKIKEGKQPVAFSGYRVSKGQFIFSTINARNGAIGIIPDYLDGAIVSKDFPVFNVDNTKVDSCYLVYCLGSEKYQQIMTQKSHGATMPRMHEEPFLDIEIELPTIEVQKRIVALFDIIAGMISARRHQLDLLDQLVKSRFIELFGDPVTNPYGWERATIADVCSSIVRGPFGSALKKEFFVMPNDTTYKVYEQKHAIQKTATVGTYYISAEKFKELRRFECCAGDIIMSCSGTMGELYQLPAKCERGIINQALCKFTLNERVLPIVFLAYMKETIDNLETKGSGIQNIAAVSYVKAMPINLPPMHLQTHFAAFVAEVDKSKLVAQKTLDNTRLSLDSLMKNIWGDNVDVDKVKKRLVKKLSGLEEIITGITDNSEIIFSFLQKYIVCEICYKALLLAYRTDKGKCTSKPSMNVNVGEVRRVFAYFNYDIDASVIDAVYSGEKTAGKRSCKKLRDEAVHELKQACLNEIVVRSKELNEKMDCVLCLFKDK